SRLHPRDGRDRGRGSPDSGIGHRARSLDPVGRHHRGRTHRAGFGRHINGRSGRAIHRAAAHRIGGIMTKQPIKFGTDGWRGVIADDYTFENVRAVAQATAEWLKREKQASNGVVIGFDTRFLSGTFAGLVAEVMAGNGIRTTFTSAFCPTPALSWAVRDRQA